MEKYYIFDFDSTFINCEALDVLAEIALAERDDRERVVGEIQRLTALGMDGSISFSESLKKRFELLSASRKHIVDLVERLNYSITTSIVANKKYFLENKDNIFIITGGFRDYVLPVVSSYGIKPEHVLANEFIFDDKDNIMGYDETNPLSQSGGKAIVVRNLKLKGDVFVIGDGYSDYEIKSAGMADKFIAFVENVHREKVVEKADLVAENLHLILDNY